MKINKCRICNNNLGIYKENNQTYCSDICYKVSKTTHQRVLSQNRVMDNIRRGKTCKRCKKHVHEKGMKTYCKQCQEDMLPKPKKKPEVIVKMREMCERCKKKAKWSDNQKTKYCQDCRVEIAKEKASVKNAEIKKKRLQKEKLNPKINKKGEKPVDPKWLTRGPIR